MEFKILNAPMYYIEGVPAYKTGEWMGHKGCKFGPTRKIVRPIEKENPLLTGCKNKNILSKQFFFFF